MKLSLDGEKSNYLYYAVLAFTLTVLLAAFAVGKVQDKTYCSEYKDHMKVVSLIQEDGLSEAEKLLPGLLEKNPSSYILRWEYGCCLAARGDYQNAREYYLKAQQLNPRLVKDQEFALQMGMILYELGEYQEASRYLKAATLVKMNDEYTKTAKELLAEIKNKS
jgi:tetratricopeptide (TPR) repeat protein